MLRSAIAKSVNLCLNLAPTISAVRADAGQIQQIVMNLITNAAEAIAPESGEVTLTTGERDFAAEELASSRLEEKPAPGRFVWMKVHDTGCGMDALTQQRLFDPFFTTKFTGRGLGLAAVLGIVRGHAGAIFVESAPGAGSTVRVLLPVPAAAAVEPTVPVPRRMPMSLANAELQHGPNCILIVDDEEILRNLCGSIVERQGWRAQLASGGEEAQEIYGREWHDIACVLLDLTMPPPDGVATFEKIMQINPTARVIICSGYGEEEALRRFQRCRPYAFIQKPYQLAELVHWLSVLEAENAGPPPTPTVA
jgi:CheY-like chemotaxis protein